VADDVRPLGSNDVENGHDVGPEKRKIVRLVAALRQTAAAQIGSDHAPRMGERCGNTAPGEPTAAKPVEEQNGSVRLFSEHIAMKPCATRFNPHITSRAVSAIVQTVNMALRFRNAQRP
jgi:hypothetical protein